MIKDVYKRQIKNNEMIKQGQIILHGDHDLSNYSEVYGFNDLFNYFVGSILIPVSYTHLDVYKRQR